MQLQTMLAMGALLILATLSINQQRSIFLLQKGAYVRELESAAADWAKVRLHQIAESEAFDEARTSMTVLDPGTSDLTLPASLGRESGEVDVTDFDDIDDYDGFVEDFTHTLSNETYGLRATYTVRYVDPLTADTTSLSQTLAKQIIAHVVSRDSIGHSTAQVTFKKTVTISDYVN
ncbi:MAG: hypothetical protein KTR29_04480 [Rhodothermaceae bacterium]|nr:hypothetical protein [Rhodothermaceae bacterium]